MRGDHGSGGRSDRQLRTVGVGGAGGVGHRAAVLVAVHTGGDTRCEGRLAVVGTLGIDPAAGGGLAVLPLVSQVLTGGDDAEGGPGPDCRACRSGVRGDFRNRSGNDQKSAVRVCGAGRVGHRAAVLVAVHAGGDAGREGRFVIVRALGIDPRAVLRLAVLPLVSQVLAGRSDGEGRSGSGRRSYGFGLGGDHGSGNLTPDRVQLDGLGRRKAADDAGMRGNRFGPAEEEEAAAFSVRKCNGAASDPADAALADSAAVCIQGDGHNVRLDDAGLFFTAAAASARFLTVFVQRGSRRHDPLAPVVSEGGDLKFMRFSAFGAGAELGAGLRAACGGAYNTLIPAVDITAAAAAVQGPRLDVAGAAGGIDGIAPVRPFGPAIESIGRDLRSRAGAIKRSGAAVVPLEPGLAADSLVVFAAAPAGSSVPADRVEDAAEVLRDPCPAVVAVRVEVRRVRAAVAADVTVPAIAGAGLDLTGVACGRRIGRPSAPRTPVAPGSGTALTRPAVERAAGARGGLLVRIAILRLGLNQAFIYAARPFCAPVAQGALDPDCI